MTTWAAETLPAAEQQLLLRLSGAIAELPELDLGDTSDGSKVRISCHMLARACSRVYRIPFEDGYFYPCFHHSWLRTAAGNVLDLYPVGTFPGTPLLMMGGNGPASWLYEVKPVDGLYSGATEEQFEKGVGAIVRFLTFRGRPMAAAGLS